MSEDMREITVVNSRLPGWAVGTMVLLALLAVGGLGMGYWASTNSASTKQSLSSDIQSMRDGYAKDMDTIQQRLAQADKQTADIQDDLSTVTKRLRITQGDLKKARAEAAQIRDDATAKLAAMDTDVKTQLAVKANTEDLNVVNGQVGVVRTDLDATKTDLADTKNNLQMARSELGTLIAKNHDEVEELRKLGERDYIEFTVDGKNKEQKVGNVQLTLRSTNPSKNQFTVALVVDDKRTEKKNRTVNEPIFFYAQGNKRAPLEIVVNSVGKDKVTGYLSIPKANQTTASANASASM